MRCSVGLQHDISTCTLVNPRPESRTCH